MTIDIKNKLSEDKIIKSLIEKYRDDKEVLEIILKAKKDLEYVRTRNSRQTPDQFLMSLTGHLEMWKTPSFLQDGVIFIYSYCFGRTVCR